MVTMIPGMRRPSMSAALIAPQAARGDADGEDASQVRPGVGGRHRQVWATDAVAVNEMSMPPATSTTSSPAARMPAKALAVSRSNRFYAVEE